jgi:Ras-related protein Ral-A
LNHLRKVSREEAEAKAKEWGCPYVETSVKERINVDEVYTDIMRKIRARKPSGNGDSSNQPKKKKSKCMIL